jgi:predicted TIM-barrel fold metal-dependent hydrolase
MTTKTGSRVIALEEHYANPEWLEVFKSVKGYQPAAIMDRLLDLGELRIREMDAAGIDVQVLSHTSPATQIGDADSTIRMAVRVNDALAETVRQHPDRFAAFAVLPTPDPAAAADELERVVTKLGFKGAMIHGLTNGVFFDDKRFWPIFARAQELDVPLYIHPSMPHPAVIEAYYKDYPGLIRASWGFGVEAGTQGLRLIMSGVFDAYPRLKIILGHLGEGIPFSLWRTDAYIARDTPLPRRVREYFCEHFYITTSGNFSFPALQCCMLEMGTDRIMFSVDYPWSENVEGVAFMESIPVSREDRDKMLHKNVERLLRL